MELLPAPENCTHDSETNEGPSGSAQSESGSRSRQRPQQIPTVGGILQQLTQLQQMVILGYMPEKTANFIQRNLKIQLDVLLKRDAGGTASAAGMPADVLRRLAREQPAALNILADFLTEDQIATLSDAPNQ